MDCYYKVDSNVMNDQMEGFQPKSLGINRDNCLQGQGNKRQNYGNYNQMGQYVWDGNYNCNNNYNQNKYGNKNNRVEAL